MDDFIFVLVCLLWAAIKGICKLLWLIISFPFKLIKNYRDRKRWNVERTDELNKRNEKEQQKRQIVENLFQKITKDIFADYNGDYLPVKMMIYYDRIELFYSTGQRKVLTYVNYVSENLVYYSFYWCTDGSQSADTTNQLMLLAEKINTLANGVYSLHSKTKESISDHSGITMHHFIQTNVEMSKNNIGI